MKDKILSLFTNPSEMTPEQIVLNIGIAAVLGFFIFISYYISHRGTIYSKKFNASLVILAALTGTVMTVIGNNIALSLGMVGALSIVRFRTAIKDPMDLIFLFWSISIGIICGGGLSAIDTAFEYAPLGDRSFTIIEMRDKIGADVNALNAYSIVRLIPEYGIKTLVNSKVVGINDTGVEIEKLDGTRETVPADVIVAAFGRKPNMELADTIRYKYPTKTTVVGDCAKPGKCGNAIREGYYAAMEII